MTRDEAQQLVQEYMKTLGQQSPGLNENGYGGVAVGNAQLYFEYDSFVMALETSALIYKFNDEPKPGIIEGFEAEEKAGTDTGGGAVDFEPENKSLFLSRQYNTVPSTASFEADMKRLMAASLKWGDEVLNRVASRVFKR